MFISPIIDRELRLALRKHKAVKARFQAAAAGAGVVGFFLLIGLLGGMRSIGREMHGFLLYVGLYMAIIPPATICVGLFSEERRNQTMELLYLAGVRPAELFSGKLLGGLLVASCNLLALAPFLAVPFLTGGIPFNLFVATLACFPALLMFVVGVGVLASVLCRDDGSAFICAVVTGAIIALATPIPYWMGKMLAGTAPFSVKWLALSPGFAPYLVAHHFGGNKPSVFWLAIGVTMGWSVLCLGLAAFLLRRNWRKELEKNTSSGWRAKWEAWIYGSAGWREELRGRLLAINPFQWLVEQDRRPLAVAWAFIGGLSLIWMLGWWTWPRVWPSAVNLYTSAMLLILGTELVMTFAVAQRIGNDRRDGALELLLTTPLMTEEIVDGQLTASKTMFRPVRMTVSGLCILMAVGGLLARMWNRNALICNGLIWCLLLGWSLRGMRRSLVMAMWIAINTGRPAYAIFRRQNAWWWISMAFNLRNFTRIFKGSSISFPSGSESELGFVCILVIAGLFLGVLFYFFDRSLREEMQEKLVAEMRSIAREPLPDPRDPRFKKWDVRHRLPRSAYDEMAERVRVYPQRVADKERAGKG